MAVWKRLAFHPLRSAAAGEGQRSALGENLLTAEELPGSVEMRGPAGHGSGAGPQRG